MKAPWLPILKWTTIILFVQSTPPTAGQSIPRPEVSQSLSFPELDRAASDVIQSLKRYFPDGKVVVIGGAAIEKYLPGLRSTRDIDIYQYMGSIEIKKELVKDPRFYTRETNTGDRRVLQESLFYRNANGKNIEIDLPGRYILDFDLASAKVLKEIPAGTVPYISVEELVLSKIQSSLERKDPAKKALDISDAKALLEKYPETIFTTEKHRQTVEKFLSEHKSGTEVFREGGAAADPAGGPKPAEGATESKPPSGPEEKPPTVPESRPAESTVEGGKAQGGKRPSAAGAPDELVEHVYVVNARTPTEVKQAKGIFPAGYKPPEDFSKEFESPARPFNVDRYIGEEPSAAVVKAYKDFYAAGQAVKAWEGDGKVRMWKIKTTGNIVPASGLSTFAGDEQVFLILGGAHNSQIQGHYEFDFKQRLLDVGYAPKPDRDRFYPNDDYNGDLFDKKKPISSRELTIRRKQKLEEMLGRPPCTRAMRKRSGDKCIMADDLLRKTESSHSVEGNARPGKLPPNDGGVSAEPAAGSKPAEGAKLPGQAEPKPPSGSEVKPPSGSEVKPLSGPEVKAPEVKPKELSLAKQTRMAVLAEEISEREFASVAVKNGYDAIAKSTWKTSLSDVRAKMLDYKKLTPESLKLSPKGVALTFAGVGFWIHGMVDAFTAESSDWDKAAAVTAIVPFVGCNTNAVAQSQGGAVDPTVNAIDAGLCNLADGLMLGVVTAPIGIALHIARWVALASQPPPSPPSFAELMASRDEPWQRFIEQNLIKSFISEAWRGKLKSAVAVEAMGIWSEACGTIGVLQAGAQLAIEETAAEQDKTRADADNATAQVRKAATDEILHRQRKNLLGLPKALLAGFSGSLEETAKEFNADFIKKMKENAGPYGVHYELASRHLEDNPPKLPSVYRLAYFIGVTASSSKGQTSVVDPAAMDLTEYYDAMLKKKQDKDEALVKHTIAMVRHLRGQIRDHDIPTSASGLPDVVEFHTALAMHLGQVFGNWKIKGGSGVGYIPEIWDKDEATLMQHVLNIPLKIATRFIPKMPVYPAARHRPPPPARSGSWLDTPQRRPAKAKCDPENRCPEGYRCNLRGECFIPQREPKPNAPQVKATAVESPAECGARKRCREGYRCSTRGKCVRPLHLSKPDSPQANPTAECGHGGHGKRCRDGYRCSTMGKCVRAIHLSKPDSPQANPTAECGHGGHGKRCRDGYRCSTKGKCIGPLRHTKRKFPQAKPTAAGSPKVPFSDATASCRDVLQSIAIAMGVGTTEGGAPAIALSVRPGTETCPQIGEAKATPVEGGHWPSCRYSLPGGAAQMPGVGDWWAKLAGDKPLAHSQIRQGGLDLESFKGCGDLREVFVSGKVRSVTAGKDREGALVISGDGDPSMEWCLSSRGFAESGNGWSCSLSSLIDDLESGGDP